jgi:hypothetical protein
VGALDHAPGYRSSERARRDIVRYPWLAA